MPHEFEHLRRVSRFVTEPTQADLGYLAGILDGEGCFYAYPTRRAFGITVQMCDECVIEWLHGHFYGMRTEARTPTGTRVFRWSLQRHSDLQFLLPRLAEHLVAKRAQADAMLRLVDCLLDPPTRHYGIPTNKLSSTRAGARERARRRRLRQAHRDKIARLSVEVREARRVG